MLKVFISYSRKDPDKRLKLIGGITTTDSNTIQFLDDQQIRAGQIWREVIQRAIDSSAAVIAICTAVSMASPEVQFEIGYAMGRGIPVIPIRWDPTCDMPAFLKDDQRFDFSVSGSENWHKLVDDVRSSTALKPTEDGHSVGLLEIGSGRSQRQRIDYIYDVLESIQPKSKLIIVGRSLTEWADVSDNLEDCINEKHLIAKLALLDENSLKGGTDVGNSVSSWIDPPIPQDWAISDVRRSMDRFRRIEVKPNTGSLSIYGLPFYASHSFVAYTRDDATRHCCQEAGMAAPKISRPYLVVATPGNAHRNTFGMLLEQMNEGVMTPDRLLLYTDGRKQTQDTTHRGKILADKVKRLGLLDLCAHREEREWFRGGVANLIDNTPDGGEIFVAGRSLIIWSAHHPQLVDAVAKRGVRCTFVIADDPTANPELKSLVKDDSAEKDRYASWENFRKAAEEIRQRECRGSFQVYGIPAFIPETFASCECGAVKFCELEVGIGVGPQDRPSMYFVRVSDHDVYSRLNKIFRKIVLHRQPSINVP